jgi:threonine aldolase
MIRFDSDYIEGAHPSILAALTESNFEQHIGYGCDEYCERARNIIREHCGDSTLGVQFLVGGTQANVTVIDAMLRSYQGVISADSGHINVHETGAPEATGHKVIALPSADGRLSLEQIAECYHNHWNDHSHEHTVQPGMVYLSCPAENGLIYSKAELTAISEFCHQHGLYLFVDGARLGYGLCAENNDLTLADLAQLCDVFYIGGTKVGALFGEAVVFSDKEMQRSFRYAIKQHGGMLAKGRLLGIQFAELFRGGNDCLYYQLARHANGLAMRIRHAFETQGIPLWINSTTNMQFPALTKEQQRILSEKYVFEVWGKYDNERDVVRFCTSWATRPEAVEELCKDIMQMTK